MTSIAVVSFMMILLSIFLLGISPMLALSVALVSSLTLCYCGVRA